MKSNQQEVVLTLFPNSVGIGYVISRNPQEIYDFGQKKIKPFVQQKFIRDITWFLNYAKPTVIILLDYENSKVKERVTNSIKDIEQLARAKNLHVLKYSRIQIKETFSVFNAYTKFDISMKLIGWYKELEKYQPKKRRLYDPEYYHSGVLDAFALMLTHYYLSE